MRKLLLALFAAALLAAFTAPAYAADFKFSGFFRVRGITSDNTDRDDDNHDGKQGYDALSRPRFTARTDGGKIWALWELDWWDSNGNGSANHVVGRTAGRVGVGTNRWVVDFAVPDSKFRLRWGRTDYVSPDKEIYDSVGRSREPGFGLYGKLSPNVSLSMFTTKTEESSSGPGTSIGPNSRDDRDDYFAALSIKANPNLTITPWVANSRDNSRANAPAPKSPGYDFWFGALHVKAKSGIMSINATGVLQGGEVSEDGKDVDLSGWAILLRTSFAMGKLKLLANLTMLSGDDDGAADEDVENFQFPQRGGSGWVNAGVLGSDRSLLAGIVGIHGRVGGTVRSVTLGRMNGAFVLDVGANYQVSKTFSTFAGVYFYNAAEAAVGEQYEDAKDFGTEFNTGFKWKLYPKLELRTVAAYMFAGDYGKMKGGEDHDDSWSAFWSLRHSF